VINVKFELTGGDLYARNFGKLQATENLVGVFRAASLEALTLASNYVAEEARKRAPYDTGALRASIRAVVSGARTGGTGSNPRIPFIPANLIDTSRPAIGGDGAFEARIIASVAYAQKVHDGLLPYGSGPKKARGSYKDVGIPGQPTPDKLIGGHFLARAIQNNTHVIQKIIADTFLAALRGASIKKEAGGEVLRTELGKRLLHATQTKPTISLGETFTGQYAAAASAVATSGRTLKGPPKRIPTGQELLDLEARATRRPRKKKYEDAADRFIRQAEAEIARRRAQDQGDE
jgi:hypothetical protein